jgi:hypothetical protein
MPKIGIGVGEEFPAQEPPPHTSEPEKPHRHGRWNIAGRIILKIAFVVLAISLIGWLFHAFAGPFAWHGPYAYGPYGYHPGWHGHFFFPFFPILLVLLLTFAFRRRHHGYGCSMRRWHDEMHRERGERN